MRLFISTSKKRKHNSNRSAFFSRLMTNLAGDTGNHIADLLVEQKIDEFKAEMQKVVDKIAASASKSKPKVEKASK